MMKELQMLQVFLTDAQAYAEGHLVGKWVQLPISKFELAQAFSEVLCEGEAVCGTTNHEETFLSDWSYDDYEFITVEEYSDVYALNDQLGLLELKSDHELKAISFLLSEGLAMDVEDAISKVDDVRVYENQSMEDIAFDLLQDCYGVDQLPSIIANNISYEDVARELELDGTYFEMGNDIFEYIG
jgi:hypothetical protein